MATWLLTLNLYVLNNDYSVYVFVCVPHVSSSVFGKLPNDWYGKLFCPALAWTARSTVSASIARLNAYVNKIYLFNVDP